MEVLFKCPTCGKVSFGVMKSQNLQQHIRCPHCEKNGIVSFMEADSGQSQVQNMGGGLYTKKENN